MQNLYLIRCEPYYKIGIANDVESRLAQLATGNPFPLELLAVYAFDDAACVEKAIHQKYARSRRRGEWFSLDNEALAEFHSICQRLGGLPTLDQVLAVDENQLEEAEVLAEYDTGAKWDFASMFKDGWRMEPTHNGRGSYEYWQWRKSEQGRRRAIYGGRIADLPYPLSEMRERCAGL